MIGRIGVNVDGRLGIITTRLPRGSAIVWQGVGLLDGKKWESWNPRLLSEAEAERIEALLQAEHLLKTQHLYVTCHCDGEDTTICRLHP